MGRGLRAFGLTAVLLLHAAPLSAQKSARAARFHSHAELFAETRAFRACQAGVETHCFELLREGTGYVLRRQGGLAPFTRKLDAAAAAAQFARLPLADVREVTASPCGAPLFIEWERSERHVGRVCVDELPAARQKAWRELFAPGAGKVTL